MTTARMPMSLRELAGGWVQTHCPIPRVRTDFLSRFDEASAGGVNSAYLFGQRLTREGKPFLLHCFAGEMFVFELTSQQVAALGVEENRLLSSLGRQLDRRTALTDPPVCLDRFILDNGATRIGSGDEVRGVCWYHQVRPTDTDLAVRMDFLLPSGATQGSFYHFDRPLWPQGSFRFTFPPMRSDALPEMSRFSGPLALFLRVVTKPDPQRVVLGAPLCEPVSNALAILVDVS